MSRRVFSVTDKLHLRLLLLAVVLPDDRPCPAPVSAGWMGIVIDGDHHVIVSADVDAAAACAQGSWPPMIPMPSGVHVYLSTGVTDMEICGNIGDGTGSGASKIAGCLDAVDEFDALDDFWQLVLAIQLLP